MELNGSYRCSVRLLTTGPAGVMGTYPCQCGRGRGTAMFLLSGRTQIGPVRGVAGIRSVEPTALNRCVWPCLETSLGKAVLRSPSLPISAPRVGEDPIVGDMLHAFASETPTCLGGCDRADALSVPCKPEEETVQ